MKGLLVSLSIFSFSISIQGMEKESDPIKELYKKAFKEAVTVGTGLIAEGKISAENSLYKGYQQLDQWLDNKKDFNNNIIFMSNEKFGKVFSDSTIKQLFKDAPSCTTKKEYKVFEEKVLRKITDLIDEEAKLATFKDKDKKEVDFKEQYLANKDLTGKDSEQHIISGIIAMIRLSQEIKKAVTKN